MSLKVCRTCCKNEGTYCLYNKNESDLQICAKVSYCCSKINIEEGDGLPSSICEECKEELEAAYKFVMKCELADRKLRSQFDVTEERIKTEVKVEKNEDLDLDRECNTVEHNIKIELKPVSNSKPCTKEITKSKALKEYTCLYCGHKSNNKKESINHLHTHLIDSSYPCPNCDRKFKIWGSVIAHMNKRHAVKKKKFVCEACGKVFFDKPNLKAHLSVHSNEKPFTCPLCPRKFTQLPSLIRHKKTHTGEKKLSCSVCAKSFYTNSDLKRHELGHTAIRTHECHICNQLLKTKQSLKNHIRLHFEPKSPKVCNNPKDHICDHCGKTFSSKYTLKDHIEKWHSVRSGHCEVCSKSVSNIEVHMWKHMGQKKFKCEMCDGSFFSFRALSIHMSFRHKHANKYKCTFEECNKSFPRPCLRDFHIAKVHKTGFTHSCDTCSRGFYRLSDLSRHKKTMHNELMVNSK